MAALWALTVLLLCAPFITLAQDISTSLPPPTTTTSTSQLVTSLPPPNTTTSTSPSVPSLPPLTTAAASTKPPLISTNLPSSSSQSLISPNASVTRSPANTSNQASNNHSDSQTITSQNATSPPDTTNQTASKEQTQYDIDPRNIKQTVSTELPATIEPTLPSKFNNLSVDYTCSDDIDPRNINQTVSTELPATIEPTLPSKCNNLYIDYTCSENGKVSDSKKPSELEPFTDYKCSGLIKVNSVSIDKRTPSIDVRINCNLELDIRERKTTNTSIELTWTTTSNNCQDVLPGLQNLSYDCSCRMSKYKSEIVTGKLMPHPGGGKCSFTGLRPFTDYTCDIDPTYKTISVGQQQRVKNLKTDAGTPDKVSHMTLTLPENNVIKVSCDSRGQLFGPRRTFRARLNNEEPLENKECDFEFRDLRYSTSYEVKVTVFNGVLESKPKILEISTKYNDKALSGFLGFLLIITVVVVFVLIYKIYMNKQRESRSGVNDDMMLESTIYMNTRPPGWRHKAAR